MRLIFAGTPVFAERALAALHEAGHEVALVLTRPDQPARRGQKLTASPVKQWALARSIPVFQPASLRPAEVQAEIAAVGADLMVVAAYGLILPQAVLDLPRWGCLNIHASLLPRWRGAAPIQRAIEAGDSETGITIMQMDAGLDTGAMRWVCRLPIGVQATGGELHDALAELGGRAVVEALAALAAGTLPSAPQPDKGITYARKLTREDARIDFALPARDLVNRIRAFDPVPGCSAALERDPVLPIKIWKARMGAPAPDSQALPAGPLPTLPGPIRPGTVLGTSAHAISVACGPQASEVIELLELQRPGGRRLPAREWLAGFPLRSGERWQVADPVPGGATSAVSADRPADGLESAGVTPTSP
jgi:methionyl-tRNA formyltransferase